MKSVNILFAILFAVYGHVATAVPAGRNCTLIKEKCLEIGGTKTIMGLKVSKPCWKKENVYTCDRANPVDTCSALYNKTGYQETASTCIDEKYATCTKYEKQYTGTIPPAVPLSTPLPSGVKRISDTKGITADTITTDCGDLSSKSVCVQKTAKTCIDTSGDKIINGLTINRTCWKWQTDYDCTVESTNTCTPVQGRADCALYKVNVLSKDSTGTPTWTEKVFKCDGSRRYAPNRQQCTNGQVAVKGGHTKIKRTANKDFANAVTYGNIMQRAAKDKDMQGHTVFSGIRKGCDTTGDLSNCCTDDGFLQQASIITCKAEQLELAKQQRKGTAYYVGAYCSEDLFGVICIKKTKTYCIFNSKLARIIQQQGRGQIAGFTWGSPDSPNCRGYTITELRNLDFSQMDLSEFFADADAKRQKIMDKNKEADLKKKVSDYYKNKKNSGGSN